MVRHGVHQRQRLGVDVPTRWATLLIGAGTVASLVAIIAVWPPSQPPLEPLPGTAAVVGPPSASTVTGQPTVSVGLRGSAPSPSPSVQPGAGAGTTPDPDPAASEVPPSTSPSPTEDEFRLVVEHSGKCADILAGATADGAEAVQWECEDRASQRFRLVDAGDGYVTIRASHSSRCLGVRDGSFQDHAPIVQVACSSSTSQQFWPQDRRRGRVRFVIRHSGKCVDVAAGSLQNGARLIQWPCHRDANQQWRVIAS